MRTSFMAFMAVDAVIFRPHPVNAQEWFEAQPETPGSLVWRPVWAELSAAGDVKPDRAREILERLRKAGIDDTLTLETP